MVQGSHWWNEPPLWAWIVMVVSAVALAVMLPFALDRRAPAEAGAPAPTGAAPTSESASTTGPSSASTGSPSPTEADGPRLVVVGDGYTSGTARGGLGRDGWPALLGTRIEGAEVDVAADVGAGYVAEGSSGRTFADLAGAADLEAADVVVIAGSRDDGPGIADQVAEAAGALFAEVGDRAPDAQLVVVGPIWPEETVPAGARNNRDVLRDAAEAAGGVFVDPLEEAWFVDQPELLGEDGVYPTDEGHAYLADRIEPAVRDALPG